MNRPEYLSSLREDGAASNAKYIPRSQFSASTERDSGSPSTSYGSSLGTYRRPTNRDSDTYAQDMRAYLRREEYEDLQRRFYPVEDQLISDVSGRDQLDERLASVRAKNSKYYELAKSSADTKRQRYGVTLSNEEKTANNNEMQAQQALSDMTARNNTRTHIYDRNLNVIGGSGARQALGDY